ncbi:MAG: hypothetical protein IPP47_26985 [Bryobacterales bacterium]|nr:hypothetical protein [Bryobacterales bacterium]
MNQETGSVLDLLRQAVEAAAGAGVDVKDGQEGLLPQALAGGDAKTAAGSGLPQTSSPVLAGIVNGLAGLTSGTAEKPAWTDWVSRINPIAGLIAGLFSGGSDSGAVEQPVVNYLRPESLRLDAGFDGANDPTISALERQEGGQYRPTAAASGGAQVVVQVQAMDSKSFLDHTPEIAEAVKRALLESNGLRDVLGEY